MTYLNYLRDFAKQYGYRLRGNRDGELYVVDRGGHGIVRQSGLGEESAVAAIEKLAVEDGKILPSVA